MPKDAPGVAETNVFAYSIRTPENVVFEFHVAGLGTRFTAWLIDLFVLIGGSIAILFALSMLSFIYGGLTEPIAGVAIFAFTWGYHMFYEYRAGGATLGKRMMGIQVISDDGLPLDLWQAIVRNLVRAVDFLSPVYFLGTCSAFLSCRHQRLGDLIAGTLVVRKRLTARPAEVLSANERYNSLLEDEILAARLRREIRAKERDLLVSLCLRRNELELEPRLELFRTAAVELRERFGLSADARLSDEKLVLNVTAVLLGGGRPAQGQTTSIRRL